MAARELAERGRDRARRLAAKLVAADAAVGLDDVEELALALDVGELMPLPVGPVPGNEACSGTLIIEYQ